jgi:predicted membrane-bound dolichyl-phosphate-mannose-protein mannosyltransferase
MFARPHDWIRRVRLSPLVVLAAVAALSLGARAVLLDEPCRLPCRSANDHLLVFDEDYYVNAARVIAGIRPPHGSPYAGAPLGDDPNAEHPQLAKLVMAGSIELFGDGPLAWRLGSLVMGTAAVLGMFALARAAGADPWVALGAAALMALDNLQLVHARIATLDAYALAAMVWGGALYLRRRPVLAGVVIGVGACGKEVAPYAVVAFALLELFRWSIERGRDVAVAAAMRVVACAVATAGTFVGLLAVLDRIATPYADAAHQVITGGAFAHIGHILSYAAAETSPHGPSGIASYPWEWLGDYKPISYLTINPQEPAPGLYHVHPSVHFLGMISPPILLAGLVGAVMAAVAVAQARAAGRLRGAVAGSEIGIVGLAWFLGTFVPFELLSAIYSRTSYLYYMVVVMPGLYLVAMHLVERFTPGRRLLAGSLIAVVVAAVIMYPFTPLPF